MKLLYFLTRNFLRKKIHFRWPNYRNDMPSRNNTVRNEELSRVWTGLTIAGDLIGGLIKSVTNMAVKSVYPLSYTFHAV